MFESIMSIVPCYPAWLQALIVIPFGILAVAAFATFYIALPCLVFLTARRREWDFFAMFVFANWLIWAITLIALCEEGVIG